MPTRSLLLKNLKIFLKKPRDCELNRFYVSFINQQEGRTIPLDDSSSEAWKRVCRELWQYQDTNIATHLDIFQSDLEFPLSHNPLVLAQRLFSLFKPFVDIF